jgi:hypothetical protein
VTGDGARVELDAEDRFPPFQWLGVAVVALDQNVAA